MNVLNNKNRLFLKSALIEENPFIHATEVMNWLKKRNQEVEVKIQKYKS